MEEISYKGETYVKGVDIAKELGYTSDYIGQLCRSKKVRCRQVGRAWYVNEESIRAHKKGRYRSSLAKTKTAVQESKKEAEKEVTEPKQAYEQNIPVHFNIKKYSTNVISYESDDTDLYPDPQKNQERQEKQASTAESQVKLRKPDNSRTTQQPRTTAGTKEVVDIVWREKKAPLTVRTYKTSKHSGTPASATVKKSILFLVVFLLGILLLLALSGAESIYTTTNGEVTESISWSINNTHYNKLIFW